MRWRHAPGRGADAQGVWTLQVPLPARHSGLLGGSVRGHLPLCIVPGCDSCDLRRFRSLRRMLRPQRMTSAQSTPSGRVHAVHCHV